MTTLPCDDGKITFDEWVNAILSAVLFTLGCAAIIFLMALAYAHSHGVGL